MITRNRIASADRAMLLEIRQKLVVQKMKLDKFFSIFLDNNELDDDEPDTPEWFTYKEMMKEYQRVNDLLKAADHHLR